MIRFLQNLENVNVDASLKASAVANRGMFATVTGDTFAPAVDLSSANGIIVRDTVVDEDVAQGFPVSEYQDTQDIVRQDEFAGVRTVFSGEQFATDQYDGLDDSSAQEGKFLEVSNGKIVPSGSQTKLVSLGWYTDAGHKLIAYKVL